MTTVDPAELAQYGQVLESHQEWKLAENVYIQFLLQDRHSFEGYSGLSRVLSAQGKNAEALEVLEDGWDQTLDPEIQEMLERKYDSLLESTTSDAEKAYDLASRSIDRGFALDRAVQALIQHAPALKRPLEAAALLDQIRPRIPSRELELLHASATLYHQGGDGTKARELISKMLRR